MTSRAYLIVRLLDVNDNPPEFERSIYSHVVREDVQVGTNFMSVYATSKDTGINADITYSINAGNEQGKFRIDVKTGETNYKGYPEKILRPTLKETLIEIFKFPLRCNW